jgi:hypothetical protein
MVAYACNELILNPQHDENDASLSRHFVFPCPKSAGKSVEQEAAIRRIVAEGRQYVLFLQSIGRNFSRIAPELHYAKLQSIAEEVKMDTGELVHDRAVRFAALLSWLVANHQWNEVNKTVLHEMLFGIDTYIFPRCKLKGDTCHALFRRTSIAREYLLPL